MTTVNIQADTYLDLVELDEDGTAGVEAVVFLGQDDEPQIVFRATFAEMLAKWISYNSIPSTPPTMRQSHKDTATALLLSMVNDLENAIEAVEEIQSWVPQGEGDGDDSSNESITIKRDALVKLVDAYRALKVLYELPEMMPEHIAPCIGEMYVEIERIRRDLAGA